MMTPTFLAQIVGKFSKDPKLMLYGRFGWEEQNSCLGEI